LLPGKYQLEIEASNRDGDWVHRTSLFIIIPPYLYQHWWFRILFVLLGLTAIAYFIYSYNQRIRMNARKKQAELRLESLRGQMNPHFIFNSLNSINYFISQNDRLSANRYIADFSRLIRSFLGNLSKEYIPFESELETIKDYLQLEHLRFGDKFEYKLVVAEDFEPENKQIFPGMVQPFIENAIWHGVRGLSDRKGTLTIQFLPGSSDHCVCIVEDDGIGRKLSLERKNAIPGKTSNGIAIVTERLRIINQIRQKNLRLIIEDLYPDREETGTRVTIEIPFRIDSSLRL
jgi:LytS/YehU family sensor histidine kinase